MLKQYSEFCYQQIGGYVLEYINYFEELRPQLTKADIEVSLPEYVAMMVFSTIITSVFSFFILGVIFVLQSGVAGFIMSLAVSIVIGGGIMLLFYLYPSILIKNRSSKIKDTLPFATMYMSTLAGTGTEISEMFAALGKQKDEYHEIAREAEKISRDIESFGLDISEALKNAADRTPSSEFKELMWGMNHVITSGGSLRDFLQQRSRLLMKDYQRRIEDFIEQLGLLVEVYITLVIVGSIVFTSMSAVMSSFTTYPPEFIVAIQMLAIFVGLPLISMMFIILVDGLAPGGVR